MVLAKLKKTWHEKVPPGPTLHPRALALVASSIARGSVRGERGEGEEEKGKRRRGRGERGEGTQCVECGEVRRKERRGD